MDICCKYEYFAERARPADPAQVQQLVWRRLYSSTSVLELDLQPAMPKPKLGDATVHDDLLSLALK